MSPHRRAPLLLAAALLAFAGCAPAERGVTLRFWAMGREGEVVQELVRDFERENPGVRVRVQQIPWSAAHEKLLTSFVGDATPDIAQKRSVTRSPPVRPQLERPSSAAATTPVSARRIIARPASSRASRR